MEQILEFLKQIIFTIGDINNPDVEPYHFRVSNLIYVSIVLAAAMFTFKKYKQLIVQLAGKFEMDEKEQKTINRAFRIILFWITVVLFFQSAGFELERITDYSLHSYDCQTIPNPDFDKDAKVTVSNPKTVESCSHFRLSNIINSFIVFFIFRIIVWTIIHLLGAYYRREKMDKGSQYAINRLIKYFIYTIMILTIIETLGFQLTVLWGAAGALLVGFGLGLQQTFNDLFSGVLIMVEGTVHVGDMVRVKGEIGKVTKIGIRASEVKMRDDVELIVPNSHLVMDGLENWNHSDQKARFFVTVGVAYGSDTQLIKKILLDIAAKQSKIIDYPEPFVRFVDFGSSSLDFQLHFWTFDVFVVPDIQSDLRFEIDKAFREHQVEIPFPQRDLWVRNPKDLK
ncbi:MAG: mechanosensitive ion channel family protein [Saprospiraceae bacterium]